MYVSPVISLGDGAGCGFVLVVFGYALNYSSACQHKRVSVAYVPVSAFEHLYMIAVFAFQVPGKWRDSNNHFLSLSVIFHLYTLGSYGMAH